MPPSSTLLISDALALPKEIVTEGIAFLGRRRSGKSYAATKLAELMYGIHAQFVALDPVGIWYGLRLAADGKDNGLQIPILGGLHGDVPLEPTSGKLIADLIVDESLSAVIDVSQFESDAERVRFAQDFAARLFFRKKSSPSAIHLFLEEAQEFAPQNPQKNETTMLHAYQRLIRLGGNYGIGMSLISQRPQDVNKKALNQVEVIFAFQLTGPQERDAVEYWIRDKGISDDLNAILPKLQQGHAHVWSPVLLRISKEVHIAAKTTFAAGSTPKVGAGAVKPRVLEPLEIEALQKKMSAAIEKAKADDPRELRKRIATLEAELRKAASVKQIDPAALDAARLEGQAEASKQFQARLAFMIEEIRAMQEKGLAVLKHQMEAMDAMPAIKSVPQKNLAQFLEESPLAGASLDLERRNEYPGPTKHVTRSGSVDTSLPAGEKAVLSVIAQYGDGATREQLTIRTGYKRSSRDAYIQRLQTKGFCQVTQSGIIATDAGIEALGYDYEPLPTGAELRRYWMDRLPEGERRILSMLIQAYPKEVHRAKLDEETGYKRSSRDAYLQRLATRKLIVIGAHGNVRAHSELF